MMRPRLNQGGTSLRRAAGARHFRLYFQDPSLQRLVVTHRLDGALTSPVHDYLGVFTKNANGSKIDIFESRKIHQIVHLHADGTARVTRTVAIRNGAPPSRFGRRFSVGYFTRLLKSLVVEYVPQAATDLHLSQNGTLVAGPLMLREREFRAVGGWSQLSPGESTIYRLSYTLPRSRSTTVYSLTMDPQPVVRAPSLQIDVFASPKEEFAPAQGWVVKGSHARWAGRLDFSRGLTLQVAGVRG